MFCKYCGKQIKDGSNFCVHCGQSLAIKNVDVEQKTNQPEDVKQGETHFQEIPQSILDRIPKPTPAPAAEPTPAPAPVPTPTPTPNFINTPAPERTYVMSEPPKPREPLSKKTIITIASAIAFVVVGAIVLLIVLLSPKKIDVLDNITVASYGKDGYGNVDIAFEDETTQPQLSIINDRYYELEDEISDVCGLNENRCEKLRHEKDLIEAIGLDINIEYEDPSQDGYHLSNGDKVYLVVDYNEYAVKELGYSFTNTRKEVRVEGLEPLVEEDVFSNIEFNWVSNYSRFKLQANNLNNKEYYNLFEYETEPDSNGNITVTIDAERLAEKYGMKPKDGKAEYVAHVGNKPELITEINDSNREGVVSVAYSVINDVYSDKCGWNLYIKQDTYLIDKNSLKDIEMSYGYAYATFNVKLETGKVVTKKISFKPYVDSDGNYKNATEYNRDRMSCTIEGSKWID